MTTGVVHRAARYLGVFLVLVAIAVGSAAAHAHTVVHDQLAAQRITMPSLEIIQAETGLGVLTDADAAALRPYAGQRLCNGPQARAYADHYLEAQMRAAAARAGVPPELATVDGLGKLVADRVAALREQLRQEPANADLTEQDIAALVNKEFNKPDSYYLNAREAALYDRLRTDTFVPGQTIRGILINAYGWWVVGSIGYLAAAVIGLAGSCLLVYQASWTRALFAGLRRKRAGVGLTKKERQS